MTSFCTAVSYETVSSCLLPEFLFQRVQALSSDSAKLTINGKGFDAWQQVRPETTQTIFQCSEVHGGTGHGVAALFAWCSNQIVASFTHLAPMNGCTGCCDSACHTVNDSWNSVRNAPAGTPSVSGSAGNTAEILTVI